MELDLGSIPKAEVKVGADVYQMSVPTVMQSIKFSKTLEECDDDVSRTEMFMNLVESLGMPPKIVEKLSIHQLTKLATGLMGDPQKK